MLGKITEKNIYLLLLCNPTLILLQLRRISKTVCVRVYQPRMLLPVTSNSL